MTTQISKWQCKISPTLGGGFAGTPNQVWGTTDYKDLETPTVFFGMYGLRDFQALWNHKGRASILWAGSDIKYLLGNYWLEKEGKQRLKVRFPNHVMHYTENSLEQIALDSVGIEAVVIPSFLGNVEDFKPQYINPRPRYYSSVSGDDFETYGWEDINKLAELNPHFEYYLYGNTVPWGGPSNVIVRGRMSQEKMNEEIKDMTGAIRATRFDGFSEILAKSVLWGQKPISIFIDYPFLRAENTREELLKILNKYEWNKNI